MKKYKRIIIYDFETNGYWSPLNQPIEVYMKIIESGKKERVFQSLIKTKYKLNSAIIQFTGITDELLAEQGRDISEVFRDIAQLLHEEPETLLVGFFNRKFDDKFLNYYLMKCWNDGWDKSWLLNWDENNIYDCAATFKADLMGLTKKEEETQAKFEHRCIYTACKHPHTLKNALEYYDIKHDGNFHRAGSDAEKTFLIFGKQNKVSLLY